jgi:hypothetical protein
MHRTEYEFKVREEYYKDQMRAAQQYNQAKRLLGSAGDKHSVARALTWLGSQLHDWGESLQERYDTATPTTLPQPR